jgi:hypothetical protein
MVLFVLMTRGQTGFEGYSVCYALRHYMQARPNKYCNRNPYAVIVKLMSCILPAVIWIREGSAEEDVDRFRNDEDG